MSIAMKFCLRNILRVIVVIYLFVNAGAHLSAQEINDCRLAFRKVFKEFKVSGNSGYAMTYSMKTILASGQTNEEEVKVLFNNSSAYVQTEASKIFKDNLATVMIDNSSKLIFISNGANELLNQARFDQITMLQDSLLNGDSEFSCESIASDQGTKSMVVTVQVNNEMSAILGLRQLKYWINEETKQIERIGAEYIKSHPQLKNIMVSFSEYDKSFEGIVFEGDALSQVFTDEGQLREDYTNYRVINNLVSQVTK